MRALILAYIVDTYATERLAFHFRQRGHQAFVVSPLDCTVEISMAGTTLRHKGKRLEDINVAFLRCMTYFHNGIAIPSDMESSLAATLIESGAVCFNSPAAKLTASNKFRTLQRLAEVGIPVPATWLVWNAEDLDHALESLGTPIVLKILNGTWGVGVAISDSVQSARSTYDALQMGARFVLAQRFIKESRGETTRVLVLGDRVLGAVKCIPKEGDFRSNIKRGATAMKVDLSESSSRLAIDAAKHLGVQIAGIDLIESADGPCVLEVNSVPGLQQFDSVCMMDSALSIVEFAENYRSVVGSLGTGVADEGD